jgi:hypothetical protein
MNYRVAFAVCFVLLIGSLLINLPGRFAVGQEAKPVDPAKGRFRHEATMQPGGTVFVVVCDTHTGQCWLTTGREKEWHDYGTPGK